MKKLVILLLGAMIAGTASAQVVKEKEAALVYYSPKTEVTVDFSFSIEIEEAGPLAEYAEELLGTSDFVSENKTTYTLKEARIGSMTQTDYSRPHKVSADAGIPLLLTINDKSILVGYNIPFPTKESSQKKPLNNKKDVESTHPISVAPYSEEILKSNDSTGLAEAIAEQIFHLRETRTYLLNGEVEHAPADGSSMKQVLAELNKQEQALTELFVGKRSYRIEQIRFSLQHEQEEQLFFFSDENGFTDSDNVDADTIRVQITSFAQEYVAKEGEVETAETVSKGKKNKKEAEPVQPKLSPIVYNLPGSALVTVVYQNHKLAQRRLPVAQLGIDVPLPMNLFSGETLPVIQFNEKTGNVISISK